MLPPQSLLPILGQAPGQWPHPTAGEAGVGRGEALGPGFSAAPPGMDSPHHTFCNQLP